MCQGKLKGALPAGRLGEKAPQQGEDHEQEPKRPKGKKELRVIPREEFHKHDKKGDIWVAIGGKVYDLSKWADSHPGGALVLETVAGHDVTDQFVASHPTDIQPKMKHFEIGYLKGWRPTDLQRDFWKVSEGLENEGKFQTNYSYYYGKLAWQLGLFAAAIGLTVYGGFWAKMLGAVALGMFWHQLSFIGHDAGHNSISHCRDVDYWCGVLVTLFYGVSGSWWKRSHNVHHIVTNSIESDPDIQHLPVFAVDEAYFREVYSTYHKRIFPFTAVERFLVGQQHFLYYPIMAVARVNLYLQSFINVCKADQVRRRVLEGLCLVIFQLWLWNLLSRVGSYSEVLAYVLVSHAITGLIHLQITLSHFGMPAYHGIRTSPQESPQDHFIQVQLETSMNVDCYPINDWFHGGLQFQVEHHLVSRLPRHYLRYARDSYIKPLCKKHNLPYYEYSFLEGNRRVLFHLREKALAARKWVF